MGKKTSKRKQQISAQEKFALKQQKKRQENIKFAVITAAIVLTLTLAIVLTVILTRPYNYVTITVSYTDDAGQAHTGDIVIKLDPSAAPITVENFKKLVKEGVYNGSNFHRVIKEFMIQGGSPASGIEPESIKGEFSENGVKNPLKHERGVISMARNSYSMDSASAQFFIVHKTSPHLDGKYAAFGHVISGMEFVDGIAEMATNTTNKPLKDAIIISATLSKNP
jgi:peptidyl-prolyl cis-trans isomerase B (cyclophilin B)